MSLSPASQVAARTLAESGAVDPMPVSANRIIKESEGPNGSPFNEHPEAETLELFAYG